MRIIDNPAPDTWSTLCARPVLADKVLDKTVEGIMKVVRELGDQALFNYTQKFDQVALKQLAYKIPKTEPAIDIDLKKAIKLAYANIKTFHSQQYESTEVVETMPGLSCWRKALPIERVGLYIPGGTAPLFSSLLMLAIPAQLAGCKNIVVCTPPQKDATIHPALIYTAQLLGLDRIYTVGGAQSIAAMTYGTESIPKVYKIFGPGNQYVTRAKQLAAMQGVAIDFPAGPSEVAVLADHNANPTFVAADLLSQAEHGIDSQVVLVSDSQQLMSEVLSSMEQQVGFLPRKSIAQKCLKQSKLLYFKDLDLAMDFINEYAPEHLILNTQNPSKWAQKVINAGSVFLGAYTPESLGDYASGTNHTLPTNGYARMYAGVSLDSYMKKITFQEATPLGLKNVGPAVEAMAQAEGLYAHKNAVTIRLQTLKP